MRVGHRILEHGPEHRRIDLLFGRKLRLRESRSTGRAAPADARPAKLLGRRIDLRQIVGRLGFARGVLENAGLFRRPTRHSRRRAPSGAGRPRFVPQPATGSACPEAASHRRRRRQHHDPGQSHDFRMLPPVRSAHASSASAQGNAAMSGCTNAGGPRPRRAAREYRSAAASRAGPSATAAAR